MTDLIPLAIGFAPTFAFGLAGWIGWRREHRLRVRADKRTLLAEEAHERACNEWMAAEAAAAIYEARAIAATDERFARETDLARCSAELVALQARVARGRHARRVQKDQERAPVMARKEQLDRELGLVRA